MEVHVIDGANTARDPGEVGALKDGKLQVLPFSFWQAFNQVEISLFCVNNGFYCIPTVELITWLRERIAGRPVLEVGAGHGVLAEALGIRATDNHQQNIPAIKAYYKSIQQAIVPYGQNVERCHANNAVIRYKPEVVIGAWVTHKFDQNAPEREGNYDGVDEAAILSEAEYINIGHSHVHRDKPIWGLPHVTYHPDWLVSRALSPGKNYIAVWGKK